MANTTETTSNYGLPLYTDSDAPDLTVDYVEAMNKIDSLIKSNASTIILTEYELKNGEDVKVDGETLGTGDEIIALVKLYTRTDSEIVNGFFITSHTIEYSGDGSIFWREDNSGNIINYMADDYCPPLYDTYNPFSYRYYIYEASIANGVIAITGYNEISYNFDIFASGSIYLPANICLPFSYQRMT